MKTPEDPWTWDEIAKRISKIEGKEISRARCQQVADRALYKLRELLKDDPQVLDYWIDNPSFDWRTKEKTRIDIDENDRKRQE